MISVSLSCVGKWPPIILQIFEKGIHQPRFTFSMKQDIPHQKMVGITKILPNDAFLRLNVGAHPISIKINHATIRRMTRLEATARLFLPSLVTQLKAPREWLNTLSMIIGIWKHGGIKALKEGINAEVHNQFEKDQYSRWVLDFDTLSANDRIAIQSRIAQLAYRPKFSVLMVAQDACEHWLRKAITSVQNQVYSNWELCISCHHSTQPPFKKMIEEFSAADPRIRVVYCENTASISEVANGALGLSTGDFATLLDSNDELAEHALYLIAEELNLHPETDLLYSDEDKIDEIGWRFHPYFKSDWNPDLFYSHNMVNHLGVYRTSLLREIDGFRKGFEGSQDYDLALRLLEKTSPEKIRHIPHVLYHCRSLSDALALDENEKNEVADAGRRALFEHFQRQGINVQIKPGIAGCHNVVYSLPTPLPKVSIIVCTRDALNLLKGAVEGVFHETDYPNIELLIVNNQSQEPATLAYFKKISSDPRVRILNFDSPFNFSSMNNFAVNQSHGEIVVLLNNDIKMIRPDWLTEMVRHAVRPAVGAVGAKLLYPNDTIQHAGVIIGIGGVAGHSHKDLHRNAYGYLGRASLTQNLSAVTAACIASRREAWDSVQGLDADNLSVAFNDVDYCLKIREKGLLIVWTPFAELYHLESATRGSDIAPDKVERFKKEIEFMQNKWNSVIERDPYYNPNLTLGKEDFSLSFSPRAAKPWLADK